MKIAIRDAWIITQNKNREILRGDLLIEDGIIKDIGKVSSDVDEEIDSHGDIVLPGLINTHTHISMAIMKGVADDVSFPDFLSRVFSIDAQRTPEDIYAGTQLGCLEMIRSGTTTFVDLYYAEDIIAKAVDEMGLRAVLCWAVLDEEFTTQKGRPLDNCKRFCQSIANKGSRITPGVGLQGVYVCSRETFLEAKEYADERNLLLHFHLSETRKEVNDHRKKTGMRPAEYLEKIGFLGRNCLASHACWLTLNEVRILAKNNTSVSTCPVSNMKLATGGVAPIPEMRKEGVVVSIGTDSSTTNNSLDMFGEMKTLSLIQKSSRWDPTVLSAQEILDFATIGGATAIGLDRLIGSIEPGKKADIVILDGTAPNLSPIRRGTLVSNVVYSSSQANVKTVICDGKVLMKNWEIKGIDEMAVLNRASEAAKKLFPND
ncbi:MAG: amidohydrolase family protein [Methanomassiliicoccales archaeon]|jgi:5-methylthioadenosine/S-adenosylhomocysteine deaminase|nr:amidohydrolase family protein [Methanomassiliicoccales archaeon]